MVARILGREIEKSLGQSVVVESTRPGLGGMFSAEAVVRAEPDGYTVVLLSAGYPSYGALSKNVKLKVVDDLTWISVVTSFPFMIYVKADSRFKTLKDLIDEARLHPGGLKYGSAGGGSLMHTAVELMGNETATKYLHVPYRGEAPAMTGILTGDVDFVAGPASERAKTGEFRALAVTGKARLRDYPDVPTAEEAGPIAGFEVVSWAGIAGPPNLPNPIVDRLNAEICKALATPEAKSKLQAMGGDPSATTPEEFKSLVQHQYDVWKKLAVEAHISVD